MRRSERETGNRLTPPGGRRSDAKPPYDNVANPTDHYPRWRLRVFDLCWEWRATRQEAIADALASGNARHDFDDRRIYLDASATIQRDPAPSEERYGIRTRRRPAVSRWG